MAVVELSLSIWLAVLYGQAIRRSQYNYSELADNLAMHTGGTTARINTVSEGINLQQTNVQQATGDKALTLPPDVPDSNH